MCNCKKTANPDGTITQTNENGEPCSCKSKGMKMFFLVLTGLGIVVGGSLMASFIAKKMS